jgi:hypothetical protein
VVVSWLSAGETLGEEQGGEGDHLIAVSEFASVRIEAAGGEDEIVDGPAVAVAPATATTVTALEPGLVARVFEAGTDGPARRAINAKDYATRNPSVLETPAESAPAQPLRVCRLDDQEASPHGRAVQTASLMLVWHATTAADEHDELTMYRHADRERIVVGLVGEQVHHVRRPWTPSMHHWRSDEHVQLASPAVSIVPPGNISATRAVGAGPHAWIDVFSPPLADVSTLS